jgi:hypothetical protein
VTPKRILCLKYGSPIVTKGFASALLAITQPSLLKEQQPDALQIWPEYGFAGRVKRIHVTERKHSQLAAFTINVTTPNMSNTSSLLIRIGE